MSNPLIQDFAKKFPGVIATLPTKGQFYPPEVIPGNTDGNVQVGILSMLDEQRYRDPFLLVSGKAVYEMIRHICPEIALPEHLAEIDVEAILLAARIASYGPALTLKHICQNPEEITKDEGVVEKCNSENTIEIMLDEFINRYAPFDADDRYELVLPMVGQTVFLQPMPYRTAIEMMRYMMTTSREFGNVMEQKVDEFVSQPEAFERYAALITHSTEIGIKSLVDSISAVQTSSGLNVFEKDVILEWLKALPIEDARLISQRIHEISTANRDLSKIEYECSECSHRNSFFLQMNPEILFLADAEASQAPKMSSASSVPNRKRSKPRLKG
jgi:hypothetical protein